jgi:hypothetical protein
VAAAAAAEEEEDLGEPVQLSVVMLGAGAVARV